MLIDDFLRKKLRGFLDLLLPEGVVLDEYTPPRGSLIEGGVEGRIGKEV